MPGSSPLITRANEVFEEYEMQKLPEALRRNSLDYYYLSIYPGLKQMSTFDVVPRPTYPDAIRNAYVHVPFCTGVCSFCSYFLTTVGSDAHTRIRDYLGLVMRELALHQSNVELDLSYLYFGGGTPSLIPPPVLAELFEFLSAQGMLAEQRFETFELHPEFFADTDNAQQFIDVLRAHGVQRVSVGLESTDPDTLARTNRRHDVAFLAEAMGLLRHNSMCVNIDLMYGLPGMTPSEWEASLDSAVACGPDSISAYFLFVDPGTAMHTSVTRGETALPSHEEIQVQHIMAQLRLEQSGYYELPNDYYAKVSDDPSSFTMGALSSEAVSLPVGAGSYGFFDRTQFANVFSLAEYGRRISGGELPMWRGYRFDDDGLMRRDVMFGLKNAPYLDYRPFADRYGEHPVHRFADLFELLDEHGMVVCDDERARATLTAKGRLCVEEIACLFRIPALTTGAVVDRREQRLLEKHNFAPTYGEPKSGPPEE